MIRTLVVNFDHTYDHRKIQRLLKSAETYNVTFKFEPQTHTREEIFSVCNTLDDERYGLAILVLSAKNAKKGISDEGYAKVYETMRNISGDHVVVIFVGDEKYKFPSEIDHVLSNWTKQRLHDQFSLERIDGRRGLVFSWNKTHRPPHTDALRKFVKTIQAMQVVPEPQSQQTGSGKLDTVSQSTVHTDVEQPYFTPTVTDDISGESADDEADGSGHGTPPESETNLKDIITSVLIPRAASPFKEAQTPAAHKPAATIKPLSFATTPEADPGQPAMRFFSATPEPTSTKGRFYLVMALLSLPFMSIVYVNIQILSLFVHYLGAVIVKVFNVSMAWLRPLVDPFIKRLTTLGSVVEVAEWLNRTKNTLNLYLSEIAHPWHPWQKVLDMIAYLKDVVQMWMNPRRNVSSNQEHIAKDRDISAESSVQHQWSPWQKGKGMVAWFVNRVLPDKLNPCGKAESLTAYLKTADQWNPWRLIQDLIGYVKELMQEKYRTLHDVAYGSLYAPLIFGKAFLKKYKIL